MFIPDFFERFFDRYIEEPNSGCWIWTASRTTAGYGNLTVERRSLYAHRCSYEAENGRGSSVGKVIRHRCDNPVCMNPAHLVAGSQRDNVQDAVRRGRMAPAVGPLVRTAKLSERDVVRMREMAASGSSVAKISRRYGVKWDTAYQAIVGIRWKHVPGALSPASLSGRAAA